jgi:hypothetical protein
MKTRADRPTDQNNPQSRPSDPARAAAESLRAAIVETLPTRLEMDKRRDEKGDLTGWENFRAVLRAKCVNRDIRLVLDVDSEPKAGRLAGLSLKSFEGFMGGADSDPSLFRAAFQNGRTLRVLDYETPRIEDAQERTARELTHARRKAEPAPKPPVKRKERPIEEHLRDPDEMLIFKVMDACPKLDAQTRNNTVKHWDVFLRAWRHSESDYTIAEKLKRPRKTIERRRKTIEAEVLEGLPLAGLKYDATVFKAAMREQQAAQSKGVKAYKSELMGTAEWDAD